MENKTEKAKLIEAGIIAFCDEHLNNEIKEYAVKLLNKLARKQTYSIERGKIEIWAASIIYVIARLNFLFDPKNENYISADTVCAYFGTKKSTTGNKATEIEKACKIRVGEPDLCSSEISDSLTIVQLSNGMVLPLGTAKKMGLVEDK